MKFSLGTTAAIVLASGAVAYWLGSKKPTPVTAAVPAPAPAAAAVPISALPPAPPDGRLPPDSLDGQLLNQLLGQAATSPGSVDRGKMRMLADQLAQDGYTTDAARVSAAANKVAPVLRTTTPTAR